MYKHLIICATIAVAGASCQPSISMVPDSGREIVGPQGTTDTEKPWNAPTRSEGDAILGPLSNMRR